MKGLPLLLLVCSISLWSGVSALGSAEADALTQILTAHPSLSEVDPADQYEADGVNYGGSWTVPMANVCENGDGWDIHGIYCVNGRVNTIRISGAFGPRVGAPPSSLSGLGALTNLTIASYAATTYDPAAYRELFDIILALPTVKVLDIPSGTDPIAFPLMAIETADLSHIRINAPMIASVPSFVGKMNLVELSVDFSLAFTDFANSASSLISLSFGLASTPAGIDTLTALETLRFRAPVQETVEYGEVIVLPPNLRSLTVLGWSSAQMSLQQANSTLQHLSIWGPALLENIAALPGTITSFELKSVTNLLYWPSPSTCYLKEFSMYDTGTSIPFGLLHTCTDLRKVSFTATDALDPIIDMDWSDTAIEEFNIFPVGNWPPTAREIDVLSMLCTLPRSSLRRLSLRNVAFATLPSCFPRFTLQSLDIRGMPLAAGPYHLTNFSDSILSDLWLDVQALGADDATISERWPQLVSDFPHLKHLTVGTGPGLPLRFPAQEFMTLHELEVLELSGVIFEGSLPETFFEEMSALKVIDLESNILNGTIPTTGWLNLERAIFRHNRFSFLPDMPPQGAPNLKYLDIASNRMTSLPPDDSFLKMPKLTHLYIGQNPDMVARFPAFWANGGHPLSFLDATGNNLQGTLPATIGSPYLRHMSFSDNRLCGPLPNVVSRMTLNNFLASDNHFQGTIPTSWGSNMRALTFVVANNFLNGSLPNPLLRTSLTRPVQAIELSNNYFRGTLPNMSAFEKLSHFGIAGENMTLDLCATDPQWPAYPSPPCTVEDPVELCNCLSFWTRCYSLSGVCSPEAPSPPPPLDTFIPSAPAYECITPLPRGSTLPGPSPPTSPPQPVDAGCPPPSPGDSFQCVDGAWKSTGSISQPTLTVPGGGVVVVEGNLTVSGGGVTFNGFESQVVVNGCIFLGENEVIIELTKEELEQLAKEGALPKTLITSLVENDCIGSSDLTETKVIVTKGTGSKGCRKVKAKNSGSTRASLQVVFNVDNSSCNMIIIIPSVIGVIFILTAIALVIWLFIRHRKFSKGL